MKLLLFVCLCALAAAEQPQQQNVPTAAQLATGLQNLYRRFLHDVHPKQLALQDVMDLQWRNGVMASKEFYSPATGIFGDVEMPSFSFSSGIIDAGQKGFFGQWSKHDTSDLTINFHYGGLVKIHVLTDAGIHEEVIFGNPLQNSDAKFVVLVPKNTYFFAESLSEGHTTFATFTAIPAWNWNNAHIFSNKEMETKFPDFAEMFKDLAKPGVHYHGGHADDDQDDHEEDDHDEK